VTSARVALPAVHARLLAIPPAQVVAAAVVLQWATIAAAAAAVRHNGWIYYQGGDQLYYYTTAWLFSHGHMPLAGIGYLWAFLLAPIAFFAGPNVASAYPAIAILDVAILMPAALLALYGIAVRVAGRLFGYWALALWILVPFVGVLYANDGYHQRYTELLLPQAFGLTAMADFPAMVATIAAAYFCARVLVDEAPTWLDAAGIGIAAGAAFAIKPSGALFLVAPVAALAFARRFGALVVAGCAAMPAALTLAVFKWRGLGSLPIARADGAHVAAGDSPTAVAGSTFGLDWSHFLHELDQIREHFWSVRFVEWLVIAGAIALLRLSRPIGLLVCVWFAAYAIGRGTYPHSGFEDGSILRLMMPAYPAFILLLAALPFLIPGLQRRVRPFASRGLRATGRALVVLGVAVAITAGLPLVAIATVRPDRGPEPRAAFLQSPPIPSGVDIGFTAKTDGSAVALQWHEQHSVGGPLFYHVYRVDPAHGYTCVRKGAVDRCDAPPWYFDVSATRETEFVDRPGRGRWTYRIGVAANWLNDMQYGDTYLLSTPVTVDVP
jgi:hypothetical protein